MLDTLFLIIIVCFVTCGLLKPHIAFMGYIWVDIVAPQTVATRFMFGQPLSMIMAIACIVAILFHPGVLCRVRSSSLTILLGIWAIWITYTTGHAFFLEEAWFKWNWAFKSIVFSIFIPFVFRGWNQLDDFLLSIIISFSYISLSAGLKGMAGGGGYGTDLIYGVGNIMSESSTMTCVAVMLMPYILYLAKYSRALRGVGKKKKYIWWGLLITHFFALVASQARTGFIALVTYILLIFKRSKKKFRLCLLLSIGSLIFFLLAPQSYFNRMNTMSNVQEEGSAYGRIIVWQWTWDMVKSNPLGGGFGAYRANEGELVSYAENYQGGGGFNTAKAFHSIYFETLGEQGYFGFLVFILLFIVSGFKLTKMRKKSGSDRELAIINATLQALIIFCVGGAFVGIAHQSILYFIFSIVLIIERIQVDNSEKRIV